MRPPPNDPPPTSAWPKIVDVQHSVWGTAAHDVNVVRAGIELGASGPPDPNMGAAVHNWPVGVVHTGNVFDNCRVVGLMGEGCNMRWGLRLHDAVGVAFQKTEFVGHVDEHHAYLGAPRDFLFRDCRFIHCGGAAIQVAHRLFEPNGLETVIPEACLIPSVHMVHRCEFRENGKPGTGRFMAFTYSEHPAEIFLPDGRVLRDIMADCVLQECSFTGGHFEFEYSGQVWRSNRTFMVGNRKSFHLLDSYIDCPAPVHGWAGQTHNVPEVILKGSEILHGKIEIKNPKKVVIEGCAGGAWVRVGTGPGLGEGLTKLLYEGPITTDWSFSES